MQIVQVQIIKLMASSLIELLIQKITLTIKPKHLKEKQNTIIQILITDLHILDIVELQQKVEVHVGEKYQEVEDAGNIKYI